MLDEIKAALATLSRPLPGDPRRHRATSQDIASLNTPFELYEARCNLNRAVAQSVTVTGCEPLFNGRVRVSYTNAEGELWVGPLSQFYATSSAAQAEVDYFVAVHDRDNAQEALSELLYTHAATLVACVEALDRLVERADEPQYTEIKSLLAQINPPGRTHQCVNN